MDSLFIVRGKAINGADMWLAQSATPLKEAWTFHRAAAKTFDTRESATEYVIENHIALVAIETA